METIWLNTKEAADFLMHSGHYLAQLASEGKLVARMRKREAVTGRGQQWEFDKADLERFRDDPERERKARPEYLTVRQSVKMTGRSQSTLAEYCRLGHLSLIPLEEVPLAERTPYQKNYLRRSEVEQLARFFQEEKARRHGGWCRTWEIKATRDDLIWFAGFFDGEGCIHIAHRKEKTECWSLRIHVPNTATAVIDNLPETFGGRCVQRKQAQPHWRPCAIWRANSRQAALILAALLPYLRVKRQQAELAIEFQDRADRGNHGRFRPLSDEDKAWRHDAYLRMCSLNRPNVIR